MLGRRPRLALAAAAAGVAALGLAAAPAAARAHVERSAAVPPCATSALVIWVTGASGAAGTTYSDLQFTNLGSRTCSLTGYPGVSAVSLGGRAIGAPARRNAVASPAAQTVRPGHTVSALLGIGDAGNYPTSTCRPVTAAGLRVYPPGQTASKIVPYPFATCAGQRDALLSTGPVVARAPVATPFG